MDIIEFNALLLPTVPDNTDQLVSPADLRQMFLLAFNGNTPAGASAFTITATADSATLTSNALSNVAVSSIITEGQAYNSAQYTKVLSANTLTLTNGGSFYVGQKVTINP